MEEKETKVVSTTTLYVDGAMNKTTGKVAWGSVVDENGVDQVPHYRNLLGDMVLREEKLPKSVVRTIIVVEFGDVKTQQNNGAELVALVAGLRIAHANPYIAKIYTDSGLIRNYWSKGYIGKETKAKMDPKKLKYIEEVTKLRKEWKGELLRVEGDDNLADLGFHVKKCKKKSHTSS